MPPCVHMSWHGNSQPSLLSCFTVPLLALHVFLSSDFFGAIYCRACVQNTVLKTWKGEEGNVEIAQAALLKRAKANSDAQLGKYDAAAEGAEGAEAAQGMYEKGYVSGRDGERRGRREAALVACSTWWPGGRGCCPWGMGLLCPRRSLCRSVPGLLAALSSYQEAVEPQAWPSLPCCNSASIPR